MNITALLLALLLTIAPFVHTSETYSLTKADFAADTTKEAVTLSDIYTEKALRIKMSYGNLRSNGSEVGVYVGFEKTGKTIAAYLGDAILYTHIKFDNAKIKKVQLFTTGNIIASKASPEEVPTSLTISIENGKLSCKELEIKNFGIGTGIEFSAIYTYASSASLQAWTGGGYITCELSKAVGWTWIFSPLWPAISLYVTVAVMIMVIVGLMAGIRKVIEE